MKKVLILESMGGVDPKSGLIFQYQKGDIVELSEPRYDDIKGNCEILTEAEKSNIKNLEQTRKDAKSARTEILGNIENRIDKTVKGKRKGK